MPIDPLMVSSGFIGGRPPPPPLPSEVINIEETQPESPMRQRPAPFPIQIPLQYKEKVAQTECLRRTPSHKAQAIQTDPPGPSQSRKQYTPHFPHHTLRASCPPYITHYTPHISCVMHSPCVVYHHTPHASCMTHSVSPSCASCNPSAHGRLASQPDTIESNQIVIQGRSLAQIIQEAREDGYREAMEQVANRMDEEFPSSE
jgi:hypothetical protein